MSHLPSDPTAPREPVRVPRGRPGTVSLAGVLMLGGAGVGFVNGVVTVVASGAIGREFRTRTAQLTGAPPAEIADLAASIQGLFLVLGGVGAALALAMVAIAIGVLRGNTAARFSAVALAGVSLFCGAGGGYGTLGLGGGGFPVTLGGAEVDLSEPLRAAVPTWLTSLTGGLGCVQTLGYIAVVVLLFLPASGAYFRRRPVPGTEPPVDPYPSAPPETAATEPVPGPVPESGDGGPDTPR